MRSRDYFYLPASAQNSEDSEELLKAEESRSICRKQKKKVSSNFRRRKSNRIYDLLLLEHIFWLKSHPPIVTSLSKRSSIEKSIKLFLKMKGEIA